MTETTKEIFDRIGRCPCDRCYDDPSTTHLCEPAPPEVREQYQGIADLFSSGGYDTQITDRGATVLLKNGNYMFFYKKEDGWQYTWGSYSDHRVVSETGSMDAWIEGMVSSWAYAVVEIAEKPICIKEDPTTSELPW